MKQMLIIEEINEGKGEEGEEVEGVGGHKPIATAGDLRIT